MRVGFVLRSAEIKPLFFDLFSISNHHESFMRCVFYTCFVSFWYRALETSNRFVFYLPPPNSTHQPVCIAKARTPGVGTVLRCSSSGGACALPSTFVWKRAMRGQSVTWLARPTNHLVLGSSTYHTTPHKSYPGLSLGFDSRLVDEFGHTR